MLGGFGAAKPVTPEVGQLALNMKPHAETKLGASWSTYEPVTYTSQVVAGTNYLVKVKVGESEYVHLKIYQPLPCAGGQPELSEAHGGKTEACPL